MKRLIFSALIILHSNTSQASQIFTKHAAWKIDSVRNQIHALQLNSAPDYSSQIASYFSYYDLDLNCDHYFGTFESNGFTLAAHVFKPSQTKGTIFFLHGYYDHTGTAKRLIRFLVDSGYSVAVYDMPGHGLSTGERASISSFETYAAILDEFVKKCSPYIPEPFILMGHSTGCAASYEYLNTYKSHPFKKAIFLAPLIRSTYYHVSKVGYTIMSPFTEKMPRWFRKSSSDKEFLKFHHSDPLACRHFPMVWAKAFYAWSEKIQNYDTFQFPLTVIQGSRDDVVEWKYNKKFFEKKVPHLTFHIIKKARHQIMNESKQFSDKFFQILGTELMY